VSAQSALKKPVQEPCTGLVSQQFQPTPLN